MCPLLPPPKSPHVLTATSIYVFSCSLTVSASVLIRPYPLFMSIISALSSSIPLYPFPLMRRPPAVPHVHCLQPCLLMCVRLFSNIPITSHTTIYALSSCVSLCLFPLTRRPLRLMFIISTGVSTCAPIISRRVCPHVPLSPSNAHFKTCFTTRSPITTFKNKNKFPPDAHCNLHT